jgi:cytochrome c peroxidase
MTLALGDRLPDATFLEPGAEGPVAVSTDALTRGRRVVLFGVPGAFTGTCSNKHVPSFVRTAEALRDGGVDDIVCVAVNDPHVMRAWGEATGATAAGIRMLADAASEYTTAIGMAYDNPKAGMFARSRRYAMLVEDGVVRVLNVEESPGQCEISAGEAMLAAL